MSEATLADIALQVQGVENATVSKGRVVITGRSKQLVMYLNKNQEIVKIKATVNNGQRKVSKGYLNVQSSESNVKGIIDEIFQDNFEPNDSTRHVFKGGDTTCWITSNGLLVTEQNS